MLLRTGRSQLSPLPKSPFGQVDCNRQEFRSSHKPAELSHRHPVSTRYMWGAGLIAATWDQWLTPVPAILRQTSLAQPTLQLSPSELGTTHRKFQYEHPVPIP